MSINKLTGHRPAYSRSRSFAGRRLQFRIVYARLRHADQRRGGEYITNFYRCTAWRRLAEIAVQYLHKGDKVTIAGDLCLRPYVDKQGAQRLSVQVNVTDLELPAKVQAAHSSARPAADDDLPI